LSESTLQVIDESLPYDTLIKGICDTLVKRGYACDGKKVLVATGINGLYADEDCKFKVITIGKAKTSRRASVIERAKPENSLNGTATVTNRATKIGLDIITQPLLLKKA
jgi:hypothetical protein